MLFAETPIIQVATGDLISAAGTLGATIATGLAGAAKIITLYLAAKEERATVERQKSDRLVRRAFRRLSAAIAAIRDVVNEIKDATEDHRPLDQHPPKDRA